VGEFGIIVESNLRAVKMMALVCIRVVKTVVIYTDSTLEKENAVILNVSNSFDAMHKMYLIVFSEYFVYKVLFARSVSDRVFLGKYVLLKFSTILHPLQ
jgi:hypothetical protein